MSELQPWERHLAFARRTPLAGRVAARSRTLVDRTFGAALISRWQADSSSEWAAAQAQRLERQAYASTPPAMEVSPFVPPQRQLNAARQGAAEWQHQPAPAAPTPNPAPAADFSDEARARLGQGRDIDTVRRELEALGWKLT